jgi:hypothetical protein
MNELGLHVPQYFLMVTAPWGKKFTNFMESGGPLACTQEPVT